MKKKILIITICIFSFFLVCAVGLGIYYKKTLDTPINTNGESEKVTIVVQQGTTSKAVIDLLFDSNLIKNKYVGYAYLKLNKNIILQAGVYEVDRNMTLPEILEYISNGNVVDDSVSLTFIEGKRLTTYVKQISDKFGYSEEEIMDKLSNKEYLETLVEKYWFLTDDVLNDKLYYALEGYLYPSTYQFAKDASIENIIEKMLTAMGAVLNEYKEKIESEDLNVHEILTMASIVELEGANSNDRKGVSGVFYNRLNSGWSLGSDVTTYYAVKVEMSERDLYQYELDDVNDYNTRSATMAGKLPIGPICGPSSDSIEASLYPTEHDYYFFVADKNKKTYFTKTNAEHQDIINKLKSEGLWYTYN